MAKGLGKLEVLVRSLPGQVGWQPELGNCSSFKITQNRCSEVSDDNKNRAGVREHSRIAWEGSGIVPKKPQETRREKEPKDRRIQPVVMIVTPGLLRTYTM
jgi:hypothetical protein